MKNQDILIKCYETNEEIYSLKDTWQTLHNDCGVPSVYNSFHFIYESIEAFQNSYVRKMVFTLTDSKNDQLIAIFPFQQYQNSWKFIRFNTCETTALNEIMDKPFPVIKNGFHDKAWTAFITHLKTNVPDWHHLFLRDIPSSFPLLKLLPEICKEQNLTCNISYDCTSTEIDIQGTWDDFWNKHKTMRRNIRKLEKKFGERMAFTVHEDNWKSCLDEYIALERKSWKNGLGVTKDDETIRFYNRYCEHMSSIGQLQFGFITVDGEAIAGVMAYTHNDTVYFPQGCYDPEYHKFSPTMVAISLFLKHFYGTHYKNVDFLCGYADFVNKWTDKKIETYDVDIYAKTTNTRLLLISQSLRDKLLSVKATVHGIFQKPALDSR